MHDKQSTGMFKISKGITTCILGPQILRKLFSSHHQSLSLAALQCVQTFFVSFQFTAFNETCGVLSTFFQNVHFADPSIPELIVSQVSTLMEQTSDLLVGYVTDSSSLNNVSMVTILPLH